MKANKVWVFALRYVVVCAALHAVAAWIWFLSGAEFKRGCDAAFLELLVLALSFMGTLGAGLWDIDFGGL